MCVYPFVSCERVVPCASVFMCEKVRVVFYSNQHQQVGLAQSMFTVGTRDPHVFPNLLDVAVRWMSFTVIHTPEGALCSTSVPGNVSVSGYSIQQPSETIVLLIVFALVIH